MLHQFAMSVVLGQAIPPQTSMLGWMLSATGSFSGLLVLLSGLLLFIGACYLITTKQRPVVFAAYLVLLPLPVLIGVCGWLKGAIVSLTVIAASPELQLTTPDIAGALANSLLHIFVALLVSAPTYFVLAFGLLSQTWDATKSTPATTRVPPPTVPQARTAGLPLAPA